MRPSNSDRQILHDIYIVASCPRHSTRSPSTLTLSAPPPPSQPDHPNFMGDFNASLGPLFICCIVSSVLFGFNMWQTFYYFCAYPKDKKRQALRSTRLSLGAFAQRFVCKGGVLRKGPILSLQIDRFASYGLVAFLAVLLRVPATPPFGIRLPSGCFRGACSFPVGGIPRRGGLSIGTPLLLLRDEEGSPDCCLMEAATRALGYTGHFLFSVGPPFWRWSWDSTATSRGHSLVDALFVIAIQADVVTCIVTTITIILYNVSASFAWMAMSMIASKLFGISFLSSLLLGKRLEKSNQQDALEMPTIHTTAPSSPSPSCVRGSPVISRRTPSFVDLSRNVTLSVSPMAAASGGDSTMADVNADAEISEVPREYANNDRI
ncbi:hypothetical protein NLJ89_g1457 [Agrocybe chaxingu]|uniref:Uncharacterized protein n=1 Tax=Agrocybe chaxingu TaxID=84603 RepID=A0A9W8N017_9AGAR|nr:hypothetical protein NLJ89_g1457 [Agrocybe chaxingu]